MEYFKKSNKRQYRDPLSLLFIEQNFYIWLHLQQV